MVLTLTLRVATTFTALPMMVPTLTPQVPALASLDLAATTLTVSVRFLWVLFLRAPIPWATCRLSREWTTAMSCILLLPTVCVVALVFWFTVEDALEILLRAASWSRARALVIWSRVVLLWRLLVNYALYLDKDVEFLILLLRLLSWTAAVSHESVVCILFCNT